MKVLTGCIRDAKYLIMATKEWEKYTWIVDKKVLKAPKYCDNVHLNFFQDFEKDNIVWQRTPHE